MVVTHGSLQRARGRCALTIGNFDGVHRGHRALIDRMVAKAREAKLSACVLTFEPHPREFFAGEAAPARLTRLRDKLELLAQAGVEHVHIARFDARFAALPAERFVEHTLVRGLGMRWLLVGRDFRFGAHRAGDFATLEAAAARHGFVLEAMPDVEFAGRRVSSSAARAALNAGDLREAERLLGHPYTISGRVAHGSKLGRSLAKHDDVRRRRSYGVPGIASAAGPGTDDRALAAGHDDHALGHGEQAPPGGQLTATTHLDNTVPRRAWIASEYRSGIADAVRAMLPPALAGRARAGLPLARGDRREPVFAGEQRIARSEVRVEAPVGEASVLHHFGNANASVAVLADGARRGAQDTLARLVLFRNSLDLPHMMYII